MSLLLLLSMLVCLCVCVLGLRSPASQTLSTALEVPGPISYAWSRCDKLNPDRSSEESERSICRYRNPARKAALHPRLQAAITTTPATLQAKL